MSRVTTHVLDTARGMPAAGIPVALERHADGAWHRVADATTDADGRAGPFGDEPLDPGRYRLTFDTDAYAAQRGERAFFPEVSIVVEVTGADHFHVPLLLSPFAYSTYRGS